uniref:cAMP-responsive element modulator n=1 Tax=Lygus hesperus TaxID=30085 RepID=A0A0A9YJS6_LYGHE
MRSRKLSLHPQDPLRISLKPGVAAQQFVLESNAAVENEPDPLSNEPDPLSNELPAEILLGPEGTTVYLRIEDTSEGQPLSNSPSTPNYSPTPDSPPPIDSPETPREQALKKKLMRQTQKLIEARKLAKKHRERAKRLQRRVEVLEAQVMKLANRIIPNQLSSTD